MSSNHIAVIGLGIFGYEVALSLTSQGMTVLAIDIDNEKVESIKNSVDQAIVMDTTDENALYEAKLDEASIVINAIGNDHIENSVMTTALLHQLGIPRIIARSTNKLHSRILRQIGATEVINPERDMGKKLAQQIAQPGLKDVLKLSEEACIAEIPVPASFVDKTLSELDVRRKYHITVIGAQRSQEKGPMKRLILSIDPTEDKFLEDDTLVVMGTQNDINRMAGLS